MFARIACGLFAVFFQASSMSAQTVTEEFSVSVGSIIGGSESARATLFGLTGIGTFSYDSSSLTGASFESINASHGLTIDIDFLGQSFDEKNDRDFVAELPNLAQFPVLSFINGQPSFLAFRVWDSPGVPNPTNISYPQVVFFQSSVLTSASPGSFDLPVDVFLAIPEPSSLLGIGGGAAITMCRRRRAT